MQGDIASINPLIILVRNKKTVLIISVNLIVCKLLDDPLPA